MEKSYYWARFSEVNNHIFRTDTRIYLNKILNPSINDKCIGAIVGKNPGSAMPKYKNYNSSLIEIVLNGDKLLPTIRNIFLKSYIPEASYNEYIQVLNLFYLCEKDLEKAINIYKEIELNNEIICITEKNEFPWIWYVWGGNDKYLNKFKLRFNKLFSRKKLFFCNKTKKVIFDFPKLDDCAKHTQGLKQELIKIHIDNLFINNK